MRRKEEYGMKINTFGYFKEKDRDKFEFDKFKKSFIELLESFDLYLDDVNIKYNNLFVDPEIIEDVYNEMGLNYMLGTLNNKIDFINLSYSKRKFDRLGRELKNCLMLLDNFVIDTNNGKFNKGVKTLCP